MAIKFPAWTKGVRREIRLKLHLGGYDTPAILSADLNSPNGLKLLRKKGLHEFIPTLRILVAAVKTPEGNSVAERAIATEDVMRQFNDAEKRLGLIHSWVDTMAVEHLIRARNIVQHKLDSYTMALLIKSVGRP